MAARSFAYLRFLPDALGNLAEIERMRGRLEAAEVLQRENLALPRDSGDRYGMVVAFAHLGEIAAAASDPRRAAALSTARACAST